MPALKAIWAFLGPFGVVSLVLLVMVSALSFKAIGERADRIQAESDLKAAQHSLAAANGRVKFLEQQKTQDDAARSALADALLLVSNNQKVRYVETTKILEDNRVWADTPLPPGVVNRLRDRAPAGD